MKLQEAKGTYNHHLSSSTSLLLSTPAVVSRIAPVRGIWAGRTSSNHPHLIKGNSAFNCVITTSVRFYLNQSLWWKSLVNQGTTVNRQQRLILGTMTFFSFSPPSFPAGKPASVCSLDRLGHLNSLTQMMKDQQISETKTSLMSQTWGSQPQRVLWGSSRGVSA